VKKVYFVKVEVDDFTPFYRGVWLTMAEVEKWVADYRNEAPKGSKVTVTVEVMHVMCNMLAKS
jgi:Zn-finger nucleic acid-binding protein